MSSLKRSLIAAAGAVCLLSACSQAGGDTPTSNAPAAKADAAYLEMVTFNEENGSVIIGNPDAEVEFVEYASLTCGHCADFHNTVMPRIKQDYIATGKVRFVFQEFPTEPIQIALAGFSLARCSGESGYLGVLDDFFGNQADIFTSGREGTIAQTLIDLGERHGIKEADFESCVTDQSYRRAVSASVDYGRTQGVNATPSLFLNGEKLETGASRTPDGLAGIIDAALTGEPSAEDESGS